MNTPLRRLSTVVLVMFLALMMSSTWVQFVQAPALNNDQRNVRTLYREYGNPRGPIVVAGESVAQSVPVDDAFRFQRVYANGPLYAHVTGHYSVVYGRTELERAMNTELNGTADSLFLRRLQDLVTGTQPQGAVVETTIDPVVQQAAWDALGDQRGAVVALEPSTGEILALVSKPSYDPTVLASHDTRAVNDAWAQLNADPSEPLVNRALRGATYPPGSTFKVVTAAAALENGMAPDTVIPAPTELPLPNSSSVLRNFGGSSCSGSGEQTLSDALRISCNTAFGRLGLDLGDDVLRETAEAFGFGSELGVPMTVTKSSFPAEPDRPQTALSAIGQYEVRVTPLQVAMISAAVANDGVLVRPTAVRSVRDQDLEVITEPGVTELGRAVSPQTASALRDMMVRVVAEGTGRSAQIPGVTVAGKTGTAQTSAEAAPHAWFTAFAPAEDPRVAVAVVVEHGGSMGNEATGGAVAAPIARAVLEAALR